MATQEHITSKIRQATIALARYKARQAVKQRLRRAGIKPTSVRACDITLQADEYLKAHPECSEWEWALDAVTKITSDAQRKRR